MPVAVHPRDRQAVDGQRALGHVDARAPSGWFHTRGGWRPGGWCARPECARSRNTGARSRPWAVRWRCLRCPATTNRPGARIPARCHPHGGKPPMHPHVSLRRRLAVAATLATTALGALPALATATDPPTAQSVCLLTKSDVQSSARYQALPAGRRAAGDRYATDLCAKVDAIVASLTPQQKANLLA